MTILIGLTGLIGSGKSAIANELVSKHGFKKLSFANTIKEIALLFGFTHQQLYGTQEQKNEINSIHGVNGREFLQKFGSEFGRDGYHVLFPSSIINKNELWCSIFENKLKNFLSKHDKVIIDDVRFDNEAFLIKRYDGKTFRIMRTGIIESNHQSENGVKMQIDCLVNDSTVEDCVKKLLSF